MKLPWIAAVATFLAVPALAAGGRPVGPTGAELAACRTAVDQPICLLKLAARGSSHQPFAADIRIGYAPDVLAAIGPEPIDPRTNDFIEGLVAPRRAAIQALIADHHGKPPREALAAIRSLPADRHIEAYEALWNAGHGDTALPAARRPSDRLTRAALDAWAEELPGAADRGYADQLAAAFRALGDDHRAEGIRLPAAASSLDRISFLTAAGKFDEAAKLLAAMTPSTDPAGRFEIAMCRMLLVAKAVEAGRKDVALRIAEAQLEAWFAEIANPSHRGAAHSGSDVPADLVLITQFAPRADAEAWAERMDAAARHAPPLPAAVSAIAAAQAWTHLGEQGRAQALLKLWPAPSDAEIKVCLSGLFKITPQCQNSPGAVLAIMLKTWPLGAPWDELMPITGPMVRAEREGRRGLTGVEADLAKATTLEARFLVLQMCARAGAETQAVEVSAECARRLAAAPSPPDPTPLPDGRLSYGERRLDGALAAARQAAETGDLNVMREMLDLSFNLALRVPGEGVNSISAAEDIAIAELRQQGRL